MSKLKEFLQWNLANPHNLNFKMIVSHEEREETLKEMQDIVNILDTGLTPDEINALRERDAAKEPEEFDGHWFKCPSCGNYAGGIKGNFCHVCGQRLKWEDMHD